MKNIFLSGLILLGLAFNALAQKAEVADPNKVKALDEFNYDKISIKERRVIPYPYLRDADVAYSKLVYRDIDVREKKNLPLKWEKNPLYKILNTAITTGEDASVPKVRSYKSEEDWGTKPMTVKEARERASEKKTLDIPIDPEDPERTIQKDTFIYFDWYKIKKYRIKEEWIFDRQRSEFYCRIIGIAPLYEREVAGLDQPLVLELCWIDYKDLRTSFVNQEIFNRQNDAQRLSYLDFFEMRLFSSYITGENNPMAYPRITDNPEFKDNTMLALYESERIKSDLFNWEHDLWEY